jgi:Right handed beta helix region
MTKLILALIACGTALVALLSSAPARAQVQRTWVASFGSNANPCTRASPCATFSTALANTAVNGEINCIDTGVFGFGLTLGITKSVTIDCHDAFAAIHNCNATPAITINIPVTAADPNRTVRLRNLSINGMGPNPNCGQNGILILSAAKVSIENVVVQGFITRGIWDARTAGGRLTVTNSVVRNNAVGLFVSPSSGQTRIDVAVSNVVAEGNNVGMAFNNGPKVQIKRSMMSNNGNTGVESTASTGVTEVHVDDSAISSNGTGLFTNVGGALRVSNSDISFNNNRALGAWITYGNNRAAGNTNLGSFPTLAGGMTGDVGQL